MLRRTGFLAVASSILALFVFQVSPAVAHHKDSHGGGRSVQQADHEAGEPDGDADDSSSTSYTEDNDTNDGNTPNNVEDAHNDHPSGNDKSVENGGSGNQGNSESDPDDDGRGQDRSNGGPDKPNGTGGEDLADQDGNNGCGNDDDFEDDNNGWCGKPTETDDQVQGASESICVEGGMAGDNVCDDTVEGDVEVAGDVGVMDDEVVAADEDDVLGTVFSRAAPAAPSTVGAAVAAAPAGVLPFTGAALIPFVIAGLGMIGTGMAIARRKS